MIARAPRWLVGAWLAIAALSIVGCGRDRLRTTAIPASRQWIASEAGTALSCTRIDAVHEVAPGVVMIVGCGMRRELVLSRDGRHAVVLEAVEAIAARDLDCDASRTTIGTPGPGVRSATGCGRRARYDLRCDHATCAWTMTAHAGAWADLLPRPPSAVDVAWDGPDADLTTQFGAAPASDLDVTVIPAPPGAPPATPPAPPAAVDTVVVPAPAHDAETVPPAPSP